MTLRYSSELYDWCLVCTSQNSSCVNHDFEMVQVHNWWLLGTSCFGLLFGGVCTTIVMLLLWSPHHPQLLNLAMMAMPTTVNECICNSGAGGLWGNWGNFKTESWDFVSILMLFGSYEYWDLQMLMYLRLLVYWMGHYTLSWKCVNTLLNCHRISFNGKEVERCHF